MYCPSCGQEQVAEGARFCSRCGFSLVEVTDLLERGRTTRALREDDAPPDKRARRAMYIMAAALPFLVLALLTGLAEADGGPEIFGLLGLLTFVIGALRLVYVVALKGWRRSSVAPALAQPADPVQAPQPHALPPAYVPPVDVPRARFDTGETAQPPSVTEHTTRRLEQEPPLERER